MKKFVMITGLLTGLCLLCGIRPVQAGYTVPGDYTHWSVNGTLPGLAGATVANPNSIDLSLYLPENNGSVPMPGPASYLDITGTNGSDLRFVWDEALVGEKVYLQYQGTTVEYRVPSVDETAYWNDLVSEWMPAGYTLWSVNGPIPCPAEATVANPNSIDLSLYLPENNGSVPMPGPASYLDITGTNGSDLRFVWDEALVGETVYIRHAGVTVHYLVPAGDAQLNWAELATGWTPQGISINNGEAYTTDAQLTIQVLGLSTEQSPKQMQIGLTPDLAGAEWEAFAESASLSLEGSTGETTVYARFQDELGNVSAVLSDGIIWDTSPPVLSGLADDAEPKLSKTWSWSASETSTYRFAVDQNTTWSPSGSFGQAGEAGISGVDGTWYVHVQARDVAGNVSAVSTVSAVLDNSPPVLSGLADDAEPKQSKTWSWSASETSTYRFAVDQNETWSPSGGFGQAGEAGISDVDGTWYVHVQARDGAGNVSAVSTASAVLDNSPPIVVFDPSGGSFETCDPLQVSLDSNEEGVQYYATLDGSGPTLDSPSDGLVFVPQTATLKAFALDQAGNQGPVAEAFFQITCPDADGDGIENGQDPDDDGDGLSDLEEDLLGTSRTSGDTDGDGLDDPDDPDPTHDNFSAEPELVKANTSEDDPQEITLETLYQDYWSDDSGSCYYEVQIDEPGNYNLLVRPVGQPVAVQPGQGRMACRLFRQAEDGDLTYLRGTSLEADTAQQLRLPLLPGDYVLQVFGEGLYNTTFQLMALKSERVYDLALYADEAGRISRQLVIPESGAYRFFLRSRNSTLGNASSETLLEASLFAGKQGSQPDAVHQFHESDPAVELVPRLELKPGWMTLNVQAGPAEEVRFWLRKEEAPGLDRTEREPNQVLSRADSMLDAPLAANTPLTRNATLGRGLDTDVFALLLKEDEGQDPHALFLDLALQGATQPEDSVLRLKLLQASGEVLKSLTFTGQNFSGQLANTVPPGLYFLSFGSHVQEPLTQTVEYSLTVQDGSGTLYPAPEDAQTKQLVRADYLGLLQQIMYQEEQQENNTTFQDWLGNAIIVNGVGDAPEDSLHIAARALADYAYKVFSQRGFEHEAIWYMSADPVCDWDGDGQTDAAADVSDFGVQDLQEAVTGWASAQNSTGPLYLYLVDHGGNQSFQLSQSNQAVLSAGELAQMLDTFQDTTGRPVLVLMEACYSGSFAAELTGGGRADRAVLFSSKASEESYIEAGGAASFSRFVLKKLGQGLQLQNAYVYAEQTIDSEAFAGYVEQTPQAGLMDLGGLYLGSGYLTAGQDWIAAPMTSRFVSVQGGDGLFADPAVQDSLELSAHIYAVTGLKRAWATVLPPDYAPPQTGGEFETPDMSPYTVELAYNPEANRYEGSYLLPDDAVAGEYALSYYLEDLEGSLASSKDMGGTSASGSLGLEAGWNLAGLWLEPAAPAWDVVLDPVIEDVISVWAWADGNWQVALPSMSEQDEAAYIQSKGFGALTDLSCGRGFWVHAQEAADLPLSGSMPAEQGSVFAPGWGLYGVKGTDSLQAEALAQEPGVVSVWKWEADAWSVLLPEETDQGAGYAQSKGFGVLEAVEPGEGFWVRVEE